MCCLFGMLDPDRRLSGRQKSEIVHALAAASEARGTDAAGIAYNYGGRLHIHKRPVPGHKLRTRIPGPVRAVMGHARLTTQGAAGKNRNNHPFLSGSGQFALAHKECYTTMTS